MLERQIIFLTGQSGAGKTALLQTMKNLWESTSFVDWVSYIDFTAKIFPSAASVFTEMLLQLGLDADSASTYESTPIPELQQVVIDAIFNCNCAILFDGLQNSHSALGEDLVPSVFSQEARNMFNSFVNELAQKKTRDKNRYPIIVLAGREADIEWWKRRLDPVDCTDEALYYLDGLDMAYAIPMARQLSLIQTPIQDDPVFIRDETLELLVRLLQGNPLSLLTICPLINLTKKATLQELIFESVPALIHKSIKCKFLGYEGTNQFRLWDIKGKHVIKSSWVEWEHSVSPQEDGGDDDDTGVSWDFFADDIVRGEVEETTAAEDDSDGETNMDPPEHENSVSPVTPSNPAQDDLVENNSDNDIIDDPIAPPSPRHTRSNRPDYKKLHGTREYGKSDKKVGFANRVMKAKLSHIAEVPANAYEALKGPQQKKRSMSHSRRQ